VTIRYGRDREDDGPKAQIREIKSGGGFLSFDAPLVHFGLGSQRSIEKVEVEWSTGEKTTLEGSLPANARYTISRH
jgi:hypothetical protein